jgi:putative oxygen-independent coproporphyrinogen III oxidase
MSSATPLGLYVHVPFCRTRCRYCDFYRVGENRPRMELFLAALGREIAGVEPPPGHRVDSIFLGGGTPSLLEPRAVHSLLGALRQRFPGAADCEVSLESNPSDLSVDRLAGYRAAGINRLSLGVQSLSDRELTLLGRRHDARRAADCVAWARAAGFANLSLDLMLGIPGQTAASFRRTVEGALALAPDHLSVYILEVHAGSEIDGLQRRRPALFPSEEAQCRRYEWLAEALPAMGYEHYEISNFARPGARCRHNLKYWRREPYLGFGPSAHSCLGSRRWRRPADLVAYLADPLAAEPQTSGEREEIVFLGLRLADGLDLGELSALLGRRSEGVRRRLAELAPLVEIDGDRVRFTVRGFLVSNAVLGEVLGWRREAIA